MLMVVQAYVDDSYKSGGVHVLAGYVSTAEAWAAFASEWEEILPRAFRNENNGNYRFKMNEMAHRMSDVQIFYNVIQKYAQHSFSILVDESDLQRAKERIWSSNVKLVFSPNKEIKKYIFNVLVEELFRQCYNISPIRDWVMQNGQIDLYVDDDTVSETILDDWYELIQSLPLGAQELVGERPRFVDDEKFLPLQAADFWAWWVRKDYEQSGRYRIRDGDFGLWKGNGIKGFSVRVNEDQIVESMIDSFKRGAVAPGLMNIYDAKKKHIDHTALAAVSFDNNASHYSYLEKLIRLVRRIRF
jgi:hypothetical protein